MDHQGGAAATRDSAKQDTHVKIVVEEQWRFDVVPQRVLHTVDNGAMVVHTSPAHSADHAIRREEECDALGAQAQRRQEVFSAYRQLR